MRFPICWPFESLHRSLAKFSSRRALVEGGGGICEIRCKNLQGERGRFGRVKAKVIRSPSPLLGERENLITHSAWRRDYHIQKSPLTRRIPPPIPRKGAWKNIKLQENLDPGPGVLRGPATRNDRRRRRRLPVRRERNSSWTRNE